MQKIKIKSIKKIESNHDRYDLTVKSTNNFYANGILIHNTSCRLANQICDRELTFAEKWLSYFGFKIQKEEYDYFAGSRRVIKDLKRKDLIHYYDLDIYNQALEKYKTSIPKGYCVYGELVGWAGEKPIQKRYTYRIAKGTWQFYVYRVAYINHDGLSTDLSWSQLKEFCIDRGFEYVAEIWSGKKKNLNVSVYADKKFVKDLNLKQCLPLDDDSPCDEGVVIRIEGNTPSLYKFKSEKFKPIETEGLDSGEIDMESMES